MRRFVLVATALGLATACGGEGVGRVYDVRGVVRDVQREYEQLLIEHEDIPGLMPAMTMNFDVADPALLATVQKGQVVEFKLEYTGRSYRILELRPVGVAGDGGSGLTLETVAAVEEAPPFALIDQTGAPLALSDLRGEAVVLDFIFTHCPGPCPTLTGILADVQKSLAPGLRARTRFVSITLDPERDSPEVLRAWAEARRLDTRDWSLLTGSVEEVDAVLESYGVAAVRQPDGNIDHVLAIFLIDPEGGIAERYLGLDHAPEEIAADLARILGGRPAD